MPDEWIKARYDLPDDPRTLRCAAAWKCSAREAVGALVEFWIYTARQGVLDDDNHALLRGVDAALLDVTMRQPGFAAALLTVDWLRSTPEGLLVPDALDWIGSSRDRSKWRKQKQRQRAAAEMSTGHSPIVHRTSGGHSTSLSLLQVDPSLQAESPAPGAKRRSGAPAAGVDGFAEFWAAYPRKTAKPAAERAWRNQRLGGGDVPGLLASIAAHARSRQWADPNFIPHPATWLNQRRWEGEAPPDMATAARPPATHDYAAEYRRRRGLDDSGRGDGAGRPTAGQLGLPDVEPRAIRPVR